MRKDISKDSCGVSDSKETDKFLLTELKKLLMVCMKRRRKETNTYDIEKEENKIVYIIRKGGFENEYCNNGKCDKGIR